MPHFGPISRRDLIAALRRAGFEEPYPGGDHQYMMQDDARNRVIIPNPHRGDISTGLLKKVLWQAEISRDEWKSFELGFRSKLFPRLDSNLKIALIWSYSKESLRPCIKNLY